MREKLLMNKGWRYYFGEPAYKRTEAASSDQTYRGSRAANARGAARRDFDDRSWEVVTLPHDFVALNGISETDAHGGEHYDFPMDRGSAWYRRYFTLSEEDREKHIVLHFEGMGTFCEVYVNSILLKTNRTNGIGFDVDITDVARFGYEQNVVSVHCDCHDFEAWYYEGGGITRNVWLVKTDRMAVDLWGTFVIAKRMSERRWQLEIQTELANYYKDARSAYVVSEIIDENGERAGWVTSDLAEIGSRQTGIVKSFEIMDDPLLWSPKAPHMYTLKTEVWMGDKCVDNYETPFGIREIVYDKDHGMFINGESTTIYGFANHMMYLGVGEAMTNSMCEYQIRTLRDMGSNGFRTAHSPHPDTVMEYCDKYGQLVMDENRIFHSSDIVIDEVRRLIKRDRNHPSVCMWSVYNEEDLVTEETGKRIYNTLAQEIRKLDPTRAISGATSYGMFSEGAHEDYDIIGFNHQTMHFDAIHAMKPDKPIYCSEMIMPLGKARKMSGMDVRAGEDAHQVQKEYVIGGFHFTAWAYGPVRPHIIGCEGSLGTGYWGFKAYLRQDEPLMKICPGWNFKGSEGKTVEVSFANNGDEVEIYVNDELVKKVETDMYAITPVELEYVPGKLTAKAYKNGQLWAEDTAYTAEEPTQIRLELENPSIAADGADAAIVSAYLVDDRGTVCSTVTGPMAKWSCSEAGELITTLSIRSDLYQGKVGSNIRFFEGKCQGLFRSLEGEEDLVVSVEVEGLPKAELVIKRDASAIKHVDVCDPSFVNDWHISKLVPGEMDDAAIMKAHETERWLPVDTVGSPSILAGMRGNPGLYPEEVPLNYGYYTKMVIPEMGEKKEGQVLALRFIGIDGKADIYVTDGKKIDHGHHIGDSPWFGHYRPELIVACDSFKPGDEVEIWVMMHEVGRVHGIGWPVHWMYTTQDEIDALDAKTAREWDYHNYGKE